MSAEYDQAVRTRISEMFSRTKNERNTAPQQARVDISVTVRTGTDRTGQKIHGPQVISSSASTGAAADMLRWLQSLSKLPATHSLELVMSQGGRQLITSFLPLTWDS